MWTFEFEIVWAVLICFVAVVLILLDALFIFFLIRNYIIRRRRKSQSKPDHVDLVSVLSVTTVTSENGPEEESIDLTEQGNGEESEAGPDAAVVIPDKQTADVHIPDVHIPDAHTPDVHIPDIVVHIPDEQDISVSMTSNISSVTDESTLC